MIDFSEAVARSQDKTDFRIRLKLIDQLRQSPGEQSQQLLMTILQNDFVFSVRLAAWQALGEMGVVQKKPQIMRDRKFMDVLWKIKHFLIRIGAWGNDWSFPTRI